MKRATPIIILISSCMVLPVLAEQPIDNGKSAEGQSIQEQLGIGSYDPKDPYGIASSKTFEQIVDEVYGDESNRPAESYESIINRALRDGRESESREALLTWAVPLLLLAMFAVILLRRAKERRLFALTLILFVGMGLFPPWRDSEGRTERYAPIFALDGGTRVDFNHLVLEWIILISSASGLAYLNRSKENEKLIDN